MHTLAVVLEAPERLALRTLPLQPLGSADILVEIEWSGVSSGTERLLWSGRMPSFPGMGYPLVPGYESVGRVVDAGAAVRERIGEWVFVPGADCYRGARGLFGGTARRVVLPSARAIPVPETLGRDGVLVALAATAHHALAGGQPPDLIVGHGVLGRLIARLALAFGGTPPTVWERRPDRRDAEGYPVIDPDEDERRDYKVICDASGDADILDLVIPRLARRGQVVLAGFYARLGFSFAPAFMREMRLRVAAEFTPADLDAAIAMIAAGRLRLDGLISHARPAGDAEHAYPAAFEDSTCLKMALDWRGA